VKFGAFLGCFSFCWASAISILNLLNSNMCQSGPEFFF
jgi:hypothetical protein